MTIRVRYEISPLGFGHRDDSNRIGMFRATEETIRTLIKKSDLDVSLCSYSDHEVALSTWEYIQSKSWAKEIQFYKLRGLSFYQWADIKMKYLSKKMDDTQNVTAKTSIRFLRRIFYESKGATSRLPHGKTYFIQ